MTTCTTCTSWQLKQAGPMARHGMAACAHGARWTYLPAQSTCAKHQPAAEAVTAARVAWLKKREG